MTNPSNIDRIVEKILSDEKMTPQKIRALSQVILAIRGIPVQEPNELPEKKNENDMMLSEDQPLDMSEVTGVSVDGETPRKVRIYKTPHDVS